MSDTTNTATTQDNTAANAANAAQTSANLLQQALEAERLKNDQLVNDNRAMREEFSKAGTHEEQMEIAKKAIKDILPKAIETINELIIAGDSESVRASLSKYVLDSVLSGKLDKSTDGEMGALLRRLADNGRNIPEEVLVSDNGVEFTPPPSS